MASQRKVALYSALLLFGSSLALLAQQPAPPYQAPPPQMQPQQPALSPQQLDDLVAPIALYPDPVLGQVLAASTYPLELMEAEQWLQNNPGLTGQALVNAAHQQNWDPSVQALVVFPDILSRLTSDISWTTSLGNAFLAQQADVMAAVQRMRARAQANGHLQTTPQQNVITQQQGGQTAIDIVPANPNVVYVPSYNPLYVWGPPIYGAYPPLWYPGLDIGFGFGPGIEIGAYFGPGWGAWGWGGWGWYPNWFGGTIFVNDRFFHRFGFGDFHGYGGAYGVHAWVHNPEHRLGVAYPNRALAGRFNGGFRGEERSGGREGFADRGNEFAGRGEAGRGFGSPSFEQHNFAGGHSAFGGIHNGGQTRMESDHGAFSTGHFGGGGGHFGGGGGHFGGGGHGGGGRR